MTILKFEGVVTTGDGFRVYEDETSGSVHVGDHDVVYEVETTEWAGPVTFALADERWSGDLAVATGWGYSEWTPIDDDRLFVGPHDIVAIIRGHEGESVTVWFADEPVILLADPT